MRGEPAAAEAGVALPQPEVCLCSSREVVPGSRNPDSGGLVVNSDLCLHTGFLVAAVAALTSHARLWGPC